VSEEDKNRPDGVGEFAGLIKYTVPGYLGGLFAGGLLDYLGYQHSPVGQWIVRTLSGEGESIFEGIYALRRRFIQASGSMAEAYGWGKFLGMAVPWIVDWGSRQGGIDVSGVGGFYIPYLYAMSDQMGANISGMVYLRRKEGTWMGAFNKYIHEPVMLASILVLLIVPVGLICVRLSGFSPITQVYTSLETIAANMCWVPPLVGWLAEKRRGRQNRGRSG